MTDEERKVNTIQKGLAKILLQNGSMFLKQAFKVSPTKEMTRAELNLFLINKGFTKPGSLSLSDEQFYFESLDFWNSFIAYYWNEQRPYETDRFDCDNFAFKFASDATDLFGLNSVGACYGNVYRKDGSWLSGHAFNLILATDENGELKVYLYEPMNDNITEWNGDKTPMGNWLYEINWSLYY